MIKFKIMSIAIILLCFFLNGCTGLIVAGAATGAAASQDPRNLSTQIHDQKTELKALNKLFKDKELWKDTKISVVSYNNLILILGQAPTFELKNKATEAINKIAKVSKVYNQIKVASPLSFFASRKDGLITSKIKSAMLFAPNFPSSKIKVITEDSEVFLMGIVTQEEADKAVEIARKISGVKKVVKVFNITTIEEENN